MAGRSKHFVGEVINGFRLKGNVSCGRWTVECTECGYSHDWAAGRLDRKICLNCHPTEDRRGSPRRFYGPGDALNGRVLIERLSNNKWRNRCEACGRETERHLSSLRASSCPCSQRRISKDSNNGRDLIDYTGKTVGSYLVSAMGESYLGGFTWTATCQKCGITRTAPISSLNQTCTNCSKIEYESALNTLRVNYTTGLQGQQLVEYRRYVACHFSEREARNRALQVQP
ncbi:hypothetical protein [Entomobacter blattae]|uniref:Uncharacterized protein n=1 Tax=Entomobacter blattae TaxID=2762277 RepID=A0A7H1NUF2_9PROT|nr:hypothetical protein [Entomobacter blattae]QNT79412.1 hypothetical protein JGUZn3_22110 [Entomobacter blattae]